MRMLPAKMKLKQKVQMRTNGGLVATLIMPKMRLLGSTNLRASLFPILLLIVESYGVLLGFWSLYCLPPGKNSGQAFLLAASPKQLPNTEGQLFRTQSHREVNAALEQLESLQEAIPECFADSGAGEECPPPDPEQPANQPESPQPRDKGDALARMGLDYVRAAPVPEDRIALPGMGGELRYNVSGDYMRAYCSRHPECSRQRTTRESEFETPVARGQGRPVGALCCWLKMGERFDSRETHMAAKTGTLQQRVDARSSFLQIEGAVEFATEHERPPRDGESDEPAKIR